MVTGEINMIEVDVNNGDVNFISFLLEKFGDSARVMGDLGVSGIFPGGLNMNSPDAFDWLT